MPGKELRDHARMLDERRRDSIQGQMDEAARLWRNSPEGRRREQESEVLRVVDGNGGSLPAIESVPSARTRPEFRYPETLQFLSNEGHRQITIGLHEINSKESRGAYRGSPDQSGRRPQLRQVLIGDVYDVFAEVISHERAMDEKTLTEVIPELAAQAICDGSWVFGWRRNSLNRAFIETWVLPYCEGAISKWTAAMLRGHTDSQSVPKRAPRKPGRPRGVQYDGPPLNRNGRSVQTYSHLLGISPHMLRRIEGNKPISRAAAENVKRALTAPKKPLRKLQ